MQKTIIPEQNQNITKQYAVSYAIITFNKMYPKSNVIHFAYKMINMMRNIKPRKAVKIADEILNKKEEKKNE